MKITRALPLARRARVSIVIPHYNYGQYLPVAVASALNQSGLDLEVIIVDDKSTDGSVEVARALAAADERITLVEHTRNLRHIRTYNDGLSRATGDYVVLLSADDALTTDSLTRSVALLEAHPGVGLVYGSVQWFDGELPPETGGRTWWQLWSGPEWVRRISHRGRNAVVNPEAVMRRSVYERTGGYDPEFPHAGDMYMWLQAAALSDVGYVGGPRQAYYRNHGANMHATEFGGVLDDMIQNLDVAERFFATDGSELPGAQRLLHRTVHSIGREALLRAALLTSEGAPPSTLHSIQDFARAADPRLVGSAAWRWATAATSRARLVGSAERLRWKVRSRRHDIVGL